MNKRFTIEDVLCIIEFADRAPVRLSADGRYLAYTIEDRREEILHEQAWVTDVDTRRSRCVLPEAPISRSAGWSPVDPALAFIADMGDGPRLWVCDVTKKDTHQVLQAVLVPTPFRFLLPQWLPDGSALVCALGSRIGQPGYDRLGKRIPWKIEEDTKQSQSKTSVLYWEYPPQRVTQGSNGTGDSQSNRYWSTLARVDLYDGSVRLLVEDIHCAAWCVSPDGQHVAYMQFIRDDAGASVYQLCVVCMDSSETRVLDANVIEDYAVSLSWSPDSRQIAYCPNHQVAVVGINDTEPRVLILSLRESWTTSTKHRFGALTVGSCW